MIFECEPAWRAVYGVLAPRACGGFGGRDFAGRVQRRMDGCGSFCTSRGSDSPSDGRNESGDRIYLWEVLRFWVDEKSSCKPERSRENSKFHIPRHHGTDRLLSEDHPVAGWAPKILCDCDAAGRLLLLPNCPKGKIVDTHAMTTLARISRNSGPRTSPVYVVGSFDADGLGGR